MSLFLKWPHEMDEYTHYFSYLQETQKFLMGDIEAVEEGNACVCVGGMTIFQKFKKIKMPNSSEK